MIIDFFQYFQLLSLLIAIWCYKGLRHFSLTWFIPFLLITNIVEISGNIKYFSDHDNYFIYNLYILSSAPIYFYLLNKMLAFENKEARLFLLICILSMLFFI